MEKKFKPKRPTGHRIFICLMPPKEVRDQARDIQRELSKFSYKLNFVNLEQVHLTLKFLGNNVSSNSADLILQALKRNFQNFGPLDLKTTKVEFGFPAQNKASTVHIQIEETDQLIELSKQIQKTTKALGLPDVIKHKESRRFLSHLTIARVRKDISRSQIRDIREILESVEFEQLEFSVGELYLIKSVLTKKGPIYSIYSKIS